MQFGDNRGVKTGVTYATIQYSNTDLSTISRATYQNFTDLLGSKHRDALLASDVIDGGLILEHNNLLTCDLRAGIAVSSQGTYISSDTWGFVAEPGSLFSVFNPRDQSVAFSAGGAQDRIDTVEIRPTQTTYNNQVRKFKDPDSGIVTDVPTDIRTEYGIEVAVRQGTESPSPVAPSRTAGWVKIAEVSVAAGTTRIDPNTIVGAIQSGLWTADVGATQIASGILLTLDTDTVIDLATYSSNLILHITSNVNLTLNGVFRHVGASITIITGVDSNVRITGTSGISTTLTGTTYFLSVANDTNMLTANFIDGAFLDIYASAIAATVKWRQVPAFLNGGITSLAFGNGIFVAGEWSLTPIDPQTRIFTSKDGLTWNAPDVPNVLNAQSAAFGNGLYLVGGGSGSQRVWTSNDGLIWGPTSPILGGSVVSIVAGLDSLGNDLYAITTVDPAVAIWTSPDGITWTQRYDGGTPTNALSAITYGNGLFVAGSIPHAGSVGILTSSDGMTWTPRVGPAPGAIESLTFANGLFVAGMGSGGSSIWTSPDGITWTERQTLNGTVGAVTYGNGLFVAGDGIAFGGSIWTSPDGITWTERQDLNDGRIDSLAFGNGVYVAGTGGAGSSIWTSPDAITWTQRQTFAGDVRALTFGDGLYVAAEIAGISGIQTSVDGITWNDPDPTPPINRIRALTFGDGVYVASGATPNGATATSPDGVIWTERQTLTHTALSLTFGNGLYVAGTENPGNSIWTSSDGITWTERQTLDGPIETLIYGNGLYVAGTSLVDVTGNSVWTSPDGITWTERQTLNGDVLALTYGNGLYVAGTGQGIPGDTIWTSPDGITWTERQTFEGDVHTLTFGNGLYVAGIGDADDAIWTSSDGLRWKKRMSTGFVSAGASIYGRGMFVISFGTQLWIPGSED